MTTLPDTQARALELANEYLQVRPDDPPDCGLRESAEALSFVIATEVLRMQFEEAKWWHHQIHHVGICSGQGEGLCCQRIAEFQRQLAATQPGATESSK